MFRLNATVRLLVSVGAALVLSTLVRTATADLNRTVGQVWPFSLASCRTASAPGCAMDQPASRIAHHGSHVLIWPTA